MIVSIDSQGKIYIPSEIRRNIGSKKFELSVEGDKIILKPIKRKIEKYYGIVKVERPLTLEDIEEKAEVLILRAVTLHSFN
ncbi:AbrB/MazE/SpoVT family DNA-binding domain-containing protein [Archaeoglobus sp.]